MDFGDIVDLQSRLNQVPKEPDRKLVPIFGSGTCINVVPGVAQLTSMFRGAMPTGGLQRFDEVVGPLGDSPIAYQNAAALVKRQGGDRALARVIRSAVLQARTDSGMSTTPLRGISRRASLSNFKTAGTFPTAIAFSPSTSRILTVAFEARSSRHFHPLIEVALREAGLAAWSVPIPFSASQAASRCKTTPPQFQCFTFTASGPAPSR